MPSCWLPDPDARRPRLGRATGERRHALRIGERAGETGLDRWITTVTSLGCLMNPSDAERLLFADALACTVDLPAAFSEHAPDAGTIERAIAKTEAVLHSIALIEDSHGEESEEQTGHEVALQRIDAKLDLLLELIGRLAQRERDRLPLRSLRWSRHGVELSEPFGTVASDHGFLLLQPVDWLPQPLELPVQRLASASGDNGQQRLYLRFTPLPPVLESAIERHLFRLHRRQIAIARQRAGS